MVLLQRLVLQGFKSFKRKASIPLPAGFSAVTGPNGSGKSNIADAISFVLGKSSSRSLRAKRGEDLIFHGSKTKGGADYAMVILYFDNSDGSLPLKEKDVSVGRRVNKSGVSTYRLNGRVVTRQQVVDLLTQGGIHPDGHNITQQGDVNQIVDMDPVQRRGIIDEISGIKEYDEKRGKAMKEMEKVAEKVREAEILLTEKGSVMAKLKAERDAALEHRNLAQELDKVKMSIILKDFSSAQEGMEKLNKEIFAKEEEFKALEGKIKKLDKDLEKEEGALTSLTKEVIQASSQIEVTRKIAQLQSSIEARKERISSLERELDRLDSLIEKVSRIENRVNPSVKEILSFSGVKGVLLDLMVVPKEYRIAAEVAAGGHLSDIVVDRMETAVKCVNHLKARRLGRARFLPLNKLFTPKKEFLPPAAIGWMSELIHYDQKYSAAMEYVFGRTACVKDIETAKQIMERQRIRMVSLDGDLVEASGAVTGGHYNSRGGTDVKSYLGEKGSLQREIEKAQEELKVFGKELSLLADKEKKTKTFDMEKNRQDIDKTISSLREDRRKAYEERLELQQEIGRLNIQKAKIEARVDNLKVQIPKKGEALDMTVPQLKQRENEILLRLQEIGPVNMKALEEFDVLIGEFEEFKEKVDKIVQEKQAIQDSIAKIEERRRETFMTTMTAVAKNFRDIYKELTAGEAELVLEDPKTIDTGLLIKASPKGKRLLNIDSMSGGEKTLTAFSFLFALQKFNPAPFYILDEADATLDKVNTQRIVSLIKKHSTAAQFIVISHNDSLVREADQVFGVTMDDGESKVMGIEVPSEEGN